MLASATSGVIEQAALMGLEALLVAALLLTLFRLRHTLGLAPVYTTLGVISQTASVLSASVYVRFGPELVIGPGSVVLFPSVLFAVLFIYIREDAKAARQAIYALLAANAVIGLLALLVAQQLKGEHVFNPLGLPAALFIQQPRVMVVGGLTLLADTILAILIYEYLGRFFARHLFFRVYVTLAVILVFDTVVFVTGCFYEQPNFGAIMLSDLIGKSCAALLYSALLAVYLQYLDVAQKPSEDSSGNLRGLLEVLTYREKYEALRLQSSVDPLTGVYNRGHFDAAFEQLLADARDRRKPLTVLFIDADHFKTINDTRGHAEGDRVLAAIAGAIRNAVRVTDIVARYGGEEFALLLPETSASDGEQMAERIRLAVPIACRPVTTLRTTVTIGVATAPLDSTDGAELLNMADQRLYAGKRAGRNCVMTSRAVVTVRMKPDALSAAVSRKKS